MSTYYIIIGAHVNIMWSIINIRSIVFPRENNFLRSMFYFFIPQVHLTRPILSLTKKSIYIYGKIAKKNNNNNNNVQNKYT